MTNSPPESTPLNAITANPILRYRNRSIAKADLDFITSQIKLHPKFGRTHLSRHLCEQWNWRAPSGSLKEYACRDLLLRLEEWGHLELPRRIRPNGQKKRGKDIALDIDCTEVTQADLNKLEVKLVTTPEDRKLWRALMDRYHYLGEGVMCGEHLLYLAYVENKVVAALGWGAASLRSPKRDQYLGWSDFETTKANLHQVTNNLRFLILPWVKVKNLGSRILSLNVRRLNADWVRRYHHQLICVETFVDTSRFQGTVYKAANWQCIGESAGRRKHGNAYQHHTAVKAIYVLRLKRLPEKGSRP